MQKNSSGTSGSWRNRIIGYDNVSPDQLLANPLNFRRHPKNQQDAMTGVLGEIGWLQDVIVNQTTGHVIDGHLCVELSLRKGEPTVPVKYVELTEDEERLALATFDPLSAMANADAAALDALLDTVNSGDAAVQAMLGQMAEEAELTQLQDAGAGESKARALGDKQHAIKPVLYAEQVGIFERAILATGERNRGAALIEICQFYLERNEKGQLDTLLESLAEAQPVA